MTEWDGDATPPPGLSEVDFARARRAVERGWLRREQVEEAIVAADRLGERLARHLPLSPEQLRALDDLGAPEPPAEVLAARDDPERRLGRYVIVEPLGAGGMGKVYRAWDGSLHRWVALKVVRDPGDERARAFFLREARLAARIDHPNVAAVHEVGEDERGRVFIAMQLVEGETLSAELGRRVGVTEVVAMMTAAARAVAAAHALDVIHRDLKPANIIRATDGTVFVLDFGLAKQLRDDGDRPRLSTTDAIMGTPLYMAPEQARGAADEVDGRSDVYALGACLYDLLTGESPHRGSTTAEVLAGIERDEPIRPRRLAPRLARDLETIVLTCLARERSRRYPTAGALADDLDRFARGEPITARPASLAYRIRLRFRRDERLRAIAAALLFVAIAIAVIVPFSRRDAARAERLAEAGALIANARRHYEADRLDACRDAAVAARSLAPELAGGRYWEARSLIRRYARTRRLPEPWLTGGVGGVVHFAPAPTESNEARRLREQAEALLDGLRATPGAGVTPGEVDAAVEMVRIQRQDPGGFALAEGRLAELLEAGGEAASDAEVGYYLAAARYYQKRFADAAAVERGVVLRLPEWIELTALALQGAALDEALARRSREAEAAYADARSFAEALAVVRPARGRLLTASVLLSRASYRIATGDRDEALDDLDEAHAISGSVIERAGDAAPADALRLRGSVRRALAAWRLDVGDHADARELVARAVADLTAALDRDSGDVPARLERGLARAFAARNEDGPDEKRRLVDAATVDLDVVLAAKLDEVPVEALLSRLDLTLTASGSEADYVAMLDDFIGRSSAPIGATLLARRGRFNAIWAERMWDYDKAGPEPVEAKFDEAKADAERAIILGPNLARAWFERATVWANYGDYLMIRGDDPTAAYVTTLESLDRTTELNPEMRVAWFTRSAKLLSLGSFKASQGEDPVPDWRESIEASMRAEEISRRWYGSVAGPQYSRAMARASLAATLWSRGQREEALAELRLAVADCDDARRRQRPGLPPRREVGWVHLQRGLLRAELGRDREAHDDLAAAVAALDACLPDDPDASEHFQDIFRWRGRALCALGRHDEAIASFEEARRRGAELDDLIEACRGHGVDER